MPGIEFRVGHTDHHKVEDFLAAGAVGVGGVRIDATKLRIHAEVADAARRGGFDVLVEPLTERMTQRGFGTANLPYGFAVPIDRRALAAASQRLALVEQVIAPQLPVATAVTPPHFFVENQDGLSLNLGLTRQTVAEYATERPIRPLLAVGSQYLTRSATEIGDRYVQAGVTDVELRVSPLDGSDVGPQAIRRVLVSLQRLRSAGLNATLGMSGTIGYATTAIGLTTGYSSGVGYRERYDHRAAMAAQRRPDDDDDGPRGALAGVYLAAADLLVPRRIARELYSNQAIRSDLGCRIGACATTLDGPLRDPRGHYLHARASQIATTMERPAAWRAVGVRDQLFAASHFRRRLATHFSADFAPKGWTLTRLVAEIDRWIGHTRSA